MPNRRRLLAIATLVGSLLRVFADPEAGSVDRGDARIDGTGEVRHTECQLARTGASWRTVIQGKTCSMVLTLEQRLVVWCPHADDPNEPIARLDRRWQVWDRVRAPIRHGVVVAPPESAASSKPAPVDALLKRRTCQRQCHRKSRLTPPLTSASTSAAHTRWLTLPDPSRSHPMSRRLERDIPWIPDLKRLSHQRTMHRITRSLPGMPW